MDKETNCYISTYDLLNDQGEWEQAIEAYAPISHEGWNAMMDKVLFNRLTKQGLPHMKNFEVMRHYCPTFDK